MSRRGTSSRITPRGKPSGYFSSLKTEVKMAVSRLDTFFFGFSAPTSVAAFRIMFGATLLLNVVLRMMHTDFYFTNAGGVPLEAASSLISDFYRPLVSWAPQTVEAAWIMQSVMVAALLAMILGVFGRVGARLNAIVIMLIHLGLLQRNYSIVYGADMVTSFWVFGLCFVDPNERWSLRAWWSRKRVVPLAPEWSRVLTSMGVRILQIQLCVIYVFTGFEKLKGTDWWDQTAVWKVLGNEQLMLADLSFLRNVPLIIGLMTWGTVLFEVYGPILFWPRATRKWSLMAGWALHIGISFTMGLFIFSLTMMSAYLLFVDPRWLDSLTRRRIIGAR